MHMDDLSRVYDYNYKSCVYDTHAITPAVDYSFTCEMYINTYL